jgi:hypothetical protein
MRSCDLELDSRRGDYAGVADIADPDENTRLPQERGFGEGLSRRLKKSRCAPS